MGFLSDTAARRSRDLLPVGTDRHARREKTLRARVGANSEAEDLQACHHVPAFHFDIEGCSVPKVLPPARYRYTHREQPSAIGAESYLGGKDRVRGKCEEFPTGRNVPNLYPPVKTASRQMSAIRAE